MKFCFENRVPSPREAVFAFHQNPARLELLHAGWSETRVLAHAGNIHLGAETWIETTISNFLPLVLGFRHTLFEPPFRFGEEEIHGPFSRFAHEHQFESLGSSTIVRDLLTISLPWYYGGEFVMKWLVAPGIRRMFQNRAHALSRLIADGTLNRCLSKPDEE
jgi:ligand-binding SRPBCC domain-containing protein